MVDVYTVLQNQSDRGDEKPVSARIFLVGSIRFLLSSFPLQAAAGPEQPTHHARMRKEKPWRAEKQPTNRKGSAKHILKR